jgi:transcriptional regulator with XRE-family HTH domain
MKIESEYCFSQALGQKITLYRERAGLKLVDLAGITKIKIEDTIAYENGTRSIQIEDFLKIANALDIDASQLIDGIKLKD